MTDIDKIDLIVPAVKVQEPIESPDRGGGEEHGFLRDWVKSSVVQQIDKEALRRNLDEYAKKLPDVLRGFQGSITEGWNLDSVTVSLAISAEGSVGIATCGLEASIEVTFKRA